MIRDETVTVIPSTFLHRNMGKDRLVDVGLNGSIGQQHVNPMDRLEDRLSKPVFRLGL